MLSLQLIDGLEAGTDEAGRGCLAGPVTAAAVILPADFNEPLLNDSKKLTEKPNRTTRPKKRNEKADRKTDRKTEASDQQKWTEHRTEHRTKNLGHFSL